VKLVVNNYSTCIRSTANGPTLNKQELLHDDLNRYFIFLFAHCSFNEPSHTRVMIP